MESLHGQFSHYDADTGFDHDYGEADAVAELPPAAIGQDERRMQVRAYNFWASLLDNRHFPSIEDLDPRSLPDFGPCSVLLDFTAGIEDPAIAFLGERLGEECAIGQEIRSLSQVPSRSLLSRITDHYMQILANQAPIGFEAEFVNQRGATILYRGILLPFSSDDDTIDFIYGVINWKELADQQTTDELLLAIDQVLEENTFPRPLDLGQWMDLPAGPGFATLDLDASTAGEGWPEPAFGHDTGQAGAGQAAGEFETAPGILVEPEVSAVCALPDQPELADWLASARELALLARGSEDRSRQALYGAVGRAYDFSLAAADAADEFRALVADAGLTMQDRAPMTPVVKLVFGADYDKTRLTEYAAALNHAHRLGLPQGGLAEFLLAAPGGLKGVVAAERQLRRAAAGKHARAADLPQQRLARKLRAVVHRPLDAVATQGSEFALLVARRLPSGEVVLLGEVVGDVPLLERAARKLLG